MNTNIEQLDAAIRDVTMGENSFFHIRKRKLEVYISFGTHYSKLAQEYPHKPRLSQAVKKMFPQSQLMQGSQRSNSKWLSEALYKAGHPANDILDVLKLTSIEGICTRTGDPTVIKRLYRKAKKKAA